MLHASVVDKIHPDGQLFMSNGKKKGGDSGRRLHRMVYLLVYANGCLFRVYVNEIALGI